MGSQPWQGLNRIRAALAHTGRVIQSLAGLGVIITRFLKDSSDWSICPGAESLAWLCAYGVKPLAGLALCA